MNHAVIQIIIKHLDSVYDSYKEFAHVDCTESLKYLDSLFVIHIKNLHM